MITQAQIAKELGVSRQLVTLALSGHPHVATETRETILAAALKMGYRPNPHARALRMKRTGIIALWIPDQISTHYNHVARELSRFVKHAGLELIISEVGDSDMRQIWSHVPVDGIVAVDASGSIQEELRGLTVKSVPVVSVGTYRSMETDHVEIDLKSGTTEAMSHLIGSGIRRIAHATFVRKDDPSESRRSEYCRMMDEAGLVPEFIHYPLDDKQRRIARELIKEHISEHGRPEAIFCHSDDVAIGIYRGLCDLNLRVPADIALVGCDGIEDTEYLETPLSTIVQPVGEICSTAWSFLQKRLENPEAAPQYATLLPKLDIRASSIH
jgi:DNA-binding LacI/PurR family transcriptional regulator